MTRRISAKYKIDRRLGVNLWGRPKSPINSREYGPGQHGQRRKKPSDFGVQLMAKQKLKGYYGNIGEKKFKKYYQEAVRRKGDTSENLIGILEHRLDAVVYRSKFVPTVFSYNVKVGDVIEVRQKSREIPLVLEAQASAEREVPDYIDLDAGKLKATFQRTPKLEDVPYPVQMEPNLIVEFYSR